MKYWINQNQKEDKIIAITKDVFYNYSPLQKDFDEFKNQLRLGKIPERLSGITFSRIRKIDFPDGQPKIEIHYDQKDSINVQIQDKKKKNEIKEALENEGPNYEYRGKTYKSIFEKSYRNVIVIVIISFLTYLTYDMATSMKQGWEYDSKGAIGALLIGVAKTTGEFGALIIGGLLILLIVINLVLKLKDKTPIETFKYK